MSHITLRRPGLKPLDISLAKPKPTDEQEKIIEAVRSTKTNLVINALAGTGKTTTLEMVQAVSKEQPVLYLAFNKAVAKEAETKFSSTTTVRTLNALGHRVWATGRNISLDSKKVPDLLRSMIKEVVTVGLILLAITIVLGLVRRG